MCLPVLEIQIKTFEFSVVLAKFCLSLDYTRFNFNNNKKIPNYFYLFFFFFLFVKYLFIWIYVHVTADDFKWLRQLQL